MEWCLIVAVIVAPVVGAFIPLKAILTASALLSTLGYVLSSL